MKRRAAALPLIFAVAFALTLLVRLPLRWVIPLLPAPVLCQGAEGSLWSGGCTSLAWRGTGGGALALGSVRWSLRPLRLLRAQLALDVVVHRGGAQATGELVRGVGRLEVLDLHAHGPLDPAVLRGFPAGWRGDLEVLGVRLRLDDGRLVALEGDVVARNLLAQAPHPTQWGSYRLHFPRRDGGTVVPGEVKDLEGPLRVEGTLKIAPDFGWQLDAGVAARPSADAELVRQLQYLGAADANGLRPLSFAGSF